MSDYLNALDASFWHLGTPTTQQVIACFCPLEQAPDPLLLQKRFEELIKRRPRLRSTITGTARPRWCEDLSFRLSDHLQFHRIPNDGSPQRLQRSAAQLFSQPWDRRKPLWKFFVLEHDNATASENKAGILFSIHHSLADGLGGLNLLNELCDAHPEISRTTRQTTQSHPRTNRGLQKSKFALARSTFHGSMKLFSEWCVPPGKSPLNGANSCERELSILELPLPQVKELAERTSASINDVLLSLVTGTFRRYHEFHHAAFRDLRAIMPVSLRPAHARDQLGNQLTGVGVTLPISLADPLDQLRRLQETIGRIKSNGSFLAYSLGAAVTSHLPLNWQRRIAEFQGRRTNLICTNMPGPAGVQFLAGAKVLGKFGMAALMRHHGSAFAFVRYADKICVSLISDPAVIREKDRIVQFFHEAWSALRENVIALDSGAQDISASKLAVGENPG